MRRGRLALLLGLGLLLGGAVQTATVSLAWDAPATGEVLGYVLYRQAAGDTFLLHAVLEGPGRTFTDTVPVGTYRYYVTAYNAAWESAPSNTVTVRVRQGRGHTK